MPSRWKRVEVRLDEWQFQILRRRAAAQQTSVTAVIRGLVEESLGTHSEADRLAALKRIRGIVKGPPLDNRDIDDIVYGPRNS